MSFRLHHPNVAVDFEQAIISVIFFTVLFANQIMICSTSAAHVPLVLSCLLNPSALAANFEQIVVPVLLYLVLFVNQTLICLRLFFTWVLCIYIILDKGCHILCVFGLNSTVCCHIVGVHLSSDQVTCDFMMDADLYNSFLLRLRIKSF